MYNVIARRGSGDALAKEFMAAERTDVDTLPNASSETADRCSPGSTCIVEADWSVWVLSVDGVTWKEVV